MPGAYHSKLAEQTVEECCKCAILPIKGAKTADWAAAPEADDAVDEAIHFFRAQVMFKEFQPDNSADITLVYNTLFIQQCIQTVKRAKDSNEGNKLLTSLGGSDFDAPGDAGFPLSGFVKAAADKDENQKWKAYFKEVRGEMCRRILPYLFNEEDMSPNKWWIGMFSKSKFLGMDLK